MTSPAPAPAPAPQRQLQLVFWVLWFAFLNGIIFFRVFLAKSAASGGTPDVFPWAFALVPALVSAVIRWVLLPGARDVQRALTWMVLGIAFAEATCIFGIFLTPSKLNLLCGASFLTVFQFAPTWAARFFPAEDKAPVENVLPRPPR